MVGNEDVYKDGTGEYTVDQLIAYIQEMRTYLDEYGARNNKRK